MSKDTKTGRGSGFFLFSYQWRMLLPLLVLMLIILAFPLGYSLWLSFHNFTITNPDENSFVGFGQYLKLLSDPLYWTVFKNTALFVVVAVGFELILGMLIALTLNKQQRFRNLTRAIVLAPMFITPIAVGLMFRFLLSEQLGFIPAVLKFFGLSVDFFGTEYAILTLAAIDIWQWTPFIVLMLIAGLQSLPEEPFEAAYVDGASKWTSFWTITLPLLKPVIIVAVLIRALDALKVFEYVYAITRGGPGNATETLQFYIQKVGFGYYRLSEASAIAWTVVVIVMVVIFVMLRTREKGEGSL
ncbi:carbohydrate ABC transporter membrane protein 1 (CUT1 family) [Bacillus oleivorans]|uniref:Carbohydrate ABC transporter membrane protein 1 (CUT1 family) n=1 Tax=Bacillus oleivorans TaxID=1448271 RepID=A0A285CI02_9BACI|nr:sugar ABC transporter permease [Bacillus oleivorans]SNX67139.1 carbohydrate ABC transporter membrane protein 1 (CUT1 family) [Bacillus oleivorans]